MGAASRHFTTVGFARWRISTGEAGLRLSSFSSSSPVFASDYENEDDEEND
jgi:hypothetical protein